MRDVTVYDPEDEIKADREAQEPTPDVESVADEVAEGGPAPVAPTAPVVPTTYNEKAERDALERRYVDSLKQGTNPQQETAAALNAAPAWYRRFLTQEPPKPKNPLAGNLIAAALSAPQQDPYWHGGYLHGTDGTPRPDRENHDPGQGARAAIGQALGQAVNRDPATEAYNNNLAAASKQAQMMHFLRSSNRTPSQDLLGGLNYFIRKDFNKRAQEKVDYGHAMDQMDSPETKATRESMVAAGLISPEQAEQLNGNQLERRRIELRQGAAQDFRAQEADIRNARSQNAQMSQQERAEALKLAGESRKQADADAQAYIPGRGFATGHAPAQAQVTEAKATESSRRDFEDAIQQQIADNAKIQAWTRTGLAASAVNQIFGGPEEQQQLLARMQTNELRIQNAIREASRWGAPQAAEFQLAKHYNPPPDSLEGWAKGKYAYEALRNNFSKAYDYKLNSLGYPKSGAPRDPAAPQSGVDIAQPQTFERVPVPERTRRGASTRSAVSPVATSPGARTPLPPDEDAGTNALIQQGLPTAAVPPIPLATSPAPNAQSKTTSQFVVLPSGARKPIDQVPSDIVEKIRAGQIPGASIIGAP